jgi:multiple sugar transport system substrate-binding protein
MAAFTAGLDYVKFIPAVPNWEQMADVTTRALQQIYLGQASPADAMKAAASQVNAIRAQP